MESDRQRTERETPPQHWRSCKLIIDPALTNGLYKVFRYDGLLFNIPVSSSSSPALNNGVRLVFPTMCQVVPQLHELCSLQQVEDLGLFPVDTVRDPRVSRLWSKSHQPELSLPKFKVYSLSSSIITIIITIITVIMVIQIWLDFFPFKLL